MPGFVRNLHQRLASNEPPDDWLFMDILRLTEEQPTDVAVTLLRCSPTCDRYRAHLPWGLRPSPVQPVQWALLDRQRVPEPLEPPFPSAGLSAHNPPDVLPAYPSGHCGSAIWALVAAQATVPWLRPP